MEEEMTGLVDKAEEEKRSFTEEEATRFDELEKEKARLDKTIKVIEAKKRAASNTEVETTTKEDDKSKTRRKSLYQIILGG